MSTGRTEVITLAQAKEHINKPLEVTQGDDSLYVLLEIAHGLVFDSSKDICSSDADVIAARAADVDAWTSDTAPPGAKAAILFLFSDMARHRGDEDETLDTESRYHSLSRRAQGYLARLRDPVLR